MSRALALAAGVHTHIGAYHILHGVDFDVPAGELTMLLGRNGAGKTTTLRTIMGLWRRRRGDRLRRPQIGGRGRAGAAGCQLARPTSRARHRLRAREHGHLRRPHGAREHAAGGARRAHRSTSSTRPARWLFGLFPALKKFWLYPAGKLSGGQKQMLAIARAIVEPRRLLLIDEPSKGLAPAIMQNLIAALRELKRTATTVLLVEQNFPIARRSATASP